MSQKTNSMIKLGLVFFLCLLSFSIGTYVGKKYSDNQYKLSQLEPGKKGGHGAGHETEGTEFAANTDSEHGDGHGTTASNEHGEKHEAAGGDSQKLTDSEVAKIAEEFANDDSSQDGKPIQTAEVEEKPIKTVADKNNTHAPSVSAHATPAKTEAAQPMAANTAPAKPLPAKVAKATNTAPNHDREPSSIPTSKEGTSVGAHYTVQIGSFPAEADAQKMTKEMLAKGIKTSYVSAQIKGQTYYRVNVGLFGTAKEADEYKKDFLEKTKISSAFVQKVQ